MPDIWLLHRGTLSVGDGYYQRYDEINSEVMNLKRCVDYAYMWAETIKDDISTPAIITPCDWVWGQYLLILQEGGGVSDILSDKIWDETKYRYAKFPCLGISVESSTSLDWWSKYGYGKSTFLLQEYSRYMRAQKEGDTPLR